MNFYRSKETNGEGLIELQDVIEASVQEATASVCTHVDDSVEEMKSVLDTLVSSMSNATNKLKSLQTIQSLLSDIKGSSSVTSLLRDIFSCKLCISQIKENIQIATCCGQIIGCGTCVERWLSDNNYCMFCKAEDAALKICELKGFDTVLSQI